MYKNAKAEFPLLSTSIKMLYRPPWSPLTGVFLITLLKQFQILFTSKRRHVTKCVRDIDIPAERTSLTCAQAPYLLHMRDLQDVRPKNALLCL
jgi:hypothetical protein